MERTVVIDCFPESAAFYLSGYAIIAVDVIRATTMAVSAVAMGRRCFMVPTLERAFDLGQRLRNPVFAGELGGDMPAGFEMSNSPAELALRSDLHRPIVLLSSSGTKLVAQASGAEALYLSCFRNFSATAQYVASLHPNIAIIGAGSRGEFREEDQMGCAWVADLLIRAGYAPQNPSTQNIVDHWKDADPSACANGNSAKYLRRSGQASDLDFILQRIDDLDAAFVMQGDEVTMSVPEMCAPVLAGAPASLDHAIFDTN
jgi:2-phosphosulfolactate phosphatase